MELLIFVSGVILYIAGLVSGAFSEILKDAVTTPYYEWKGKNDKKRENHDALRSHIDDFCQIWENFKCENTPHVHLRKDLIEHTSDMLGIVARNCEDFNNISKSVKEFGKQFLQLARQSPTVDDANWSSAIEHEGNKICTHLKNLKTELM
jgi:hypothetical protein